ncbi:hypothetical protein ACFL46_00225 [Candidatus Neomarinimicrobiota bacterium]
MRKQYHFRPSEKGILIWDVQRLVKLTKNLPTKKVELEAIRELDEPFWFGNEKSVPTCRVIAEHVKLIEESDLMHPVILSRDGRIMDGMHRVVKALLKGHKQIKAIQFTKDPKPDYIDVDSADLPYDSPA